MVRIVPADSRDSLELARELFVEYTKALGIDLSFQNFAQELAQLPGEYAPPDGRLLLAFDDAQLAGCGALRKIHGELCEMKRLYVRPAVRGRGVGEILVRALVHHALALRYFTMKLDTAPELAAARALYRRLGFREIPRYRSDQLPDTVCYELHLIP